MTTLALVGLPALADALAPALGADLLADPSPKTTAQKIKTALVSGERFPVIVADGPAISMLARGLPNWSRAVASLTRLVVLHLDGATGAADDAAANGAIFADQAARPEGIEASALLALAGLDDLGIEATIASDGSLTRPQPAVDWGDDADDDDEPFPYLAGLDIPERQTPPTPFPAPAPASPASAPASEGASVVQRLLYVYNSAATSVTENTDEDEPADDIDDEPLSTEPVADVQVPLWPSTVEQRHAVPEPEPVAEHEPVPAPVSQPPVPRFAAQPSPQVRPAVQQRPVPDPFTAAKPVPQPVFPPVTTQPRAAEPAYVAPVSAPVPQVQPAAAFPPVHLSVPAQPAAPARPRHTDASLEAVDDFLYGDEQDVSSRAVARSARLGRTIVIQAAKGGVGKDAISATLAYYASTYGPEGFRVVLIDANRGQGDARSYLRLNRAQLPSVYDAALSPGQDPALALITPAQVAAHRDPSWGQVHFSLMLAPRTGEQYDPRVLTPAFYARCIQYARERADLVIVVTQVKESVDTSGLWTQVLDPLVITGHAYALGLIDASNVAIPNLRARATELIDQGATLSHWAWAANRVPPEYDSTIQGTLERNLLPGEYLGTIHVDPLITADQGSGRIPFGGENPEMRAVCMRMLHKVTGLDEFALREEPKAKKRGLFGRRK